MLFSWICETSDYSFVPNYLFPLIIFVQKCLPITWSILCRPLYLSFVHLNKSSSSFWLEYLGKINAKPLDRLSEVLVQTWFLWPHSVSVSANQSLLLLNQDDTDNM